MRSAPHKTSGPITGATLEKTLLHTRRMHTTEKAGLKLAGPAPQVLL